MPETLDGTYEQSLRRIDKQKRDFARRLFQCLVVSKRPLRVKELAELFAIQPDVDTIPRFNAHWRPENPEEFILSACSTLVAIVKNRGQKIVQFSHFSVREYLTSDRIAISEHVSRFHVLPRPAHALIARACLSVLQLDDHVIRNQISDFPLASYAARYWVYHAQFDDVASEIQHGMKRLFDKDRPHFAAWHRLYNIDNAYPYLMPSLPRVAYPYLVPLYCAALCGFRDIADHLINVHPQHVNAPGRERVTPLHAAVDKGHLSTAMLLLQRGADLGSRDFVNRTPLHIASYRGHAEIVSLLIYYGANPNAETNNRETPLFLASKYGRQNAARLLLEHGANANRSNAKGLTPLRAAWQEGHIDNVRLLLDYGADVKSSDNRGKSPLHLVLQESHYRDILLLDPPVPSSLRPNPAFLERRLDIVKLLLEHGADTKYPDKYGATPLHIASRKGFIDIVQLLIHHGADANLPDNQGVTPLHITSQEGFIDIVQLLFHHGADANRQDNHGETPLRIASQGGFMKIVLLLLRHGADANLSDNDGWSPLHAASQEGYNTVVLLLLDYGAAADHPDSDGWTPLHAASQGGHDHLVQLLLDRGAAPNHQDNRGRTPLHIAWKRIVLLHPDAGANGPDSGPDRTLLSKRRNDNIVRLLLKYGADVNQPDSDGLTPLHLALQAGSAHVDQLI